MIHHSKWKTIKFHELNAKFGNYELNRMKWVLDCGSPLFLLTKYYIFLSKTYFYIFYCKRQVGIFIPNLVGIKLSNYSYKYFSITPVFIPQLAKQIVWGKMVLLGPFNPCIRIQLDCFVFMEMCEIQGHGKCVKIRAIVNMWCRDIVNMSIQNIICLSYYSVGCNSGVERCCTSAFYNKTGDELLSLTKKRKDLQRSLYSMAIQYYQVSNNSDGCNK